MALSNMQVFSQFAYSSMTETVAQQIDLFNAASRGAIQLRQAANVGDYTHEAMFQELSGLVRRRDAYGSGSVNAVSLAQLDHIGVKVAAGTPPIKYEQQQFRWIQQNPDTAGTVYGEQLAEAMIQDMVNAAIRSLKAAMVGNKTSGGYTGVLYESVAANLTLNALNRGAALFGDRANSIRTWVIHSTPMTDLVDNVLTNSSRLFEFGTVNIMEDGFGRRFIVTDSAPLYLDGGTAPDTYFTLGLVEGAAVVEDNDDLFTNDDTSNGTENIITTIQSEWTYNLKLKGYQFNTATSAESPTDTELGTSTNWVKFVSDNKNTAGVAVQTLGGS
jgi:hypothetical protein